MTAMEDLQTLRGVHSLWVDMRASLHNPLSLTRNRQQCFNLRMKVRKLAETIRNQRG